MDSEIQRLTLEVEDRRESAESWDAWNIRILSIAGFAALLLVITAIGVSRSNRELLRSSDELDRAKDSKLALELRTKDEEIARAQQLAAEAKQKAEAEQLARVKIEEKMAPRHLSPEQRKSMATKLLQFGGQKVQIVTFSGDSEIARIADDVMAALNGANDGAR
jgi:hypothetical protein